MIKWMIWNNRNSVWRNRWQDDAQVNRSAEFLLQEWSQAQATAHPTIGYSEEESDRKWVPPLAGTLKCNVDAALPTHAQQLGFGFIIRDWKGEVIVVRNGRMVGPTEALVAEALGCREALQWIYRNGVVNVIVESDSQVLVSLIKKPSALSSSVGLIINDCKSLIQTIMGCSILHIRRSANHAV